MFLCCAAGNVQKSLFDALELVENIWNLIVGHSKRGNSAKPESSSAPFVIRKALRGCARATSNSGCVPMSDISRSSNPFLPGATDLRGYPSQC